MDCRLWSSVSGALNSEFINTHLLYRLEYSHKRSKLFINSLYIVSKFSTAANPILSLLRVPSYTQISTGTQCSPELNNYASSKLRIISI